MPIKYVGPFEISLRKEPGSVSRHTTLLWGDPVHPIEDEDGNWISDGKWRKVGARDWQEGGWVRESELTDQGILEVYVIDVGKGDSILMRTPDDRWHLIDAGVANRSQMTRKGTANFLRWKFYEDLLLDRVSLENIIVTHPDYDHYGGLLDVLAGDLGDGRTFDIDVENFYHNGLGRYHGSPELGAEQDGVVDPFPHGDHGLSESGTFYTELLDDADSFANPPRDLKGSFEDLAELVRALPDVRRLSHRDEYLPGYEPGAGDVAIRVLGPILEEFDGTLGLRELSGVSKTRNGHSIVLRVDYGSARILLTGDLNENSQRLLLSYQPEWEFAVDVAKACHHGSEDIELDFLKAMQPRSTVVSSGDNESFSHPRALVLGASARYGRESESADGDVLPPLLYSTELARSVDLEFADSVRVENEDGSDSEWTYAEPRDTQVRPDRRGEDFQRLDYTPLSVGLVYGLVNIRTDGEHMLLATMKESGTDFDVKVFKAGVPA